MARNKSGRPEWFKFWRRNRRQLDIEQLSMESRGIVFTNIMRYFDDADEQNLLAMDGIESMAFNVVKINVDDSFAEYAERAKTNRENGSKGGRPPETEENRKNPVGFIETETKRDNPKEEERIKSSDARVQSSDARGGADAAKPPRPTFSPPSLEEVRAYCRERGNSIDAQRFIDFYASNGWRVGKNPMRDWKAAVRTWENNGYDTQKKSPKYASTGQQKPLSSDEWDKIMEAI